MTVYIRAEDIQIDSDEDGWNLTVTDEASGKSICINFQALALEFYDNVRHTLGPYATEAAAARATMPQMVYRRPVDIEEAIDAGYALDDPKSPGYHDRMVD